MLQRVTEILNFTDYKVFLKIKSISVIVFIISIIIKQTFLATLDSFFSTRL